MTMVERMALAILNSDRVAAGLPEASSRDNIPDSDGYVRNARAVLEEMLKPTPGMVEAGLTTSGRYGCNAMTEIYSRMITAALQEGKGE